MRQAFVRRAMINPADLLPAFLLSALGLPLWVRLGGMLGWIDQPMARSTHAVPVARVGGLAVALGLTGGLVMCFGGGHEAFDAGHLWWPYVVPALLFSGIGVGDDAGVLSSRAKFALQCAAAAVAVALGLRWEGQALEPFGALTFGLAGAFMTWLWIVAVVTLVNLLDGLDLITAATCAVLLGVAAGAGTGPGDGLLYAVSLAALLGFVPWNVKPARAFLGDSGTHLLGFLVATAALGLPGETQALPWVLASAPLLPSTIDLAWGIVQKRRLRVPLAQAHNQHVSQRLTHAGWSHATVAVRYGVLGLLALVLAAVVAPRWGFGTCLGLAAGVLLWHLTQAKRAARGIPYRF